MPNQDKSNWFTQARFGLFIHWGLYAIPARGEWVQSREQIPASTYHQYFDEFNPTRYHPRQWAQLARQAGMKYAILTAKHHEGFCLWDTALTDFKATNTSAQRDLVREFVDAFRAEGLRVGFYYSLLDWHHPHYTLDFHHPLRNLPKDDPQFSMRSMPQYVDYLHAQVRELLSNYGPIDILWFDFSYGDKRAEAWRAADLVQMVRELQPHILMNNRLSGAGTADEVNPAANIYGEINTPEQLIPREGLTDAGGNPVVWEACMTLNDNWGYARDDRNFKTPAEVVRMLVECVSKGGNLLLNVGPTAKGEIQPEAQAILHRVGDWMRLNGESIRGATRAAELSKPDWGRYTQSAALQNPLSAASTPRTLYAHILERPTGPIVFHNLAGKIKRARYLADGSELQLTKPWNAPENSLDLHANLPRTPLPDDLDTVLALELTPNP